MTFIYSVHHKRVNLISLRVVYFLLYALSFLGYVDKIGVAFEAPTISTGFGAYLAQVRIVLTKKKNVCSPFVDLRLPKVKLEKKS